MNQFLKRLKSYFRSTSAREQRDKLDILINIGFETMTSLQDIKDALAKAAADAASQKVAVGTALANLTATVNDLKAKLAQAPDSTDGLGLSQSDLDDLLSKVQGIDTAVNAISTSDHPAILTAVTATEATQPTSVATMQDGTSRDQASTAANDAKWPDEPQTNGMPALDAGPQP